ncbi:MAG: hypothetical protein E7620_08190 [Ruminococcaceae bacterium]|nr:hypothetical protein [Oscillospiraceae bacterium]
MSILKKALSLILCAAMLTCAFTSCLNTPSGLLVDTTVKNLQGDVGPSSTIAISDDGYWVINGTKTAYKAVGENGKDGKDGITPTITINADGFWVINGTVSQYRAVGQDGTSPTVEISNDGYWVLNGTKSAHKATASNGKDGANGITPQLQISPQTNEWEVSYDEGKTWKSLGVKASATSNGATIEKVEFNEKGQLVITMTNGQAFVADLPAGEAHVHTYGERMDFRGNELLPCDQRIYFHVCSTCNEMKWVYGKSSDHSFDETYEYDTENHWQVCANCSQATTIPEAHTVDENGACTVCGHSGGKLPVFQMDLKSREIRICACGPTQDIYVDAPTDAISRAIWERTISTEERLNTIIVVDYLGGTSGNYNETIQQIKNNIEVGMTSWDLISCYSNVTQSLTIGSYFRNLCENEYFVSDADYWSQSLVQNLTVNSRLFSVTGDISRDYMDQASVIFFNPELADIYQLENLYETVLNGEWTLEKMNELAANIYTDSNSNGTVDIGDRFGLLLNTATRMDFFTAAGLSLISNDASLIEPNAKFLDFHAELLELFNSAASFSLSSTSDLTDQFTNGNALFLNHRLGNAVELNKAGAAFGILPLPKYDLEQTEYRTQSNFSQLWSIPLSVDSADASALALTSLAYDSNKLVISPHREQLLGNNQENTSQREEILNLIYNSIYINMDTVYATDLTLFNFYRQIITNKLSPTVWWAQNVGILQSALEMILTPYTD